MMTDYDGVALFAALLDIALIPTWTRWWAKALRRSRYFPVALALVAFATFAFFSAVPFLVMKGAFGLFSGAVTHPKYLIGLAIYAIPSILLQLWYVIYFVRQHDKV